MGAPRITKPAWLIAPVGMDDAAHALGISRTTLTESLKRLPYYERRGAKKVFYPEHIERLRRELHACASGSNGLTVGPTSTAPAPMAPVSAVLSELAMLARRKKPARN